MADAMIKNMSFVLAAALAVSAHGQAAPQAAVAAFQLPASDLVQLPDLALGKWMIAPDLTPAHWIGEIDGGKSYREPINIILEDRLSATPEEAEQRLIAGCVRAGYPPRFGHSSGYKGYMEGRLFAQLPGKRARSFSSGPFELNNNHGRVFGPLARGGKYYFIAAFSRERVDPVSKIMHRYDSFDQARDQFSQSLDRLGIYRVVAFEKLDNAFIGDLGLTTGDHDGVAVRLLAQQTEADKSFTLGEDYYAGRGGMTQDCAQALSWLRKAAGLGHDGAIYRLGAMALAGQCVKLDLSESLKLFRKAAELGNREAMTSIGIMTESGQVGAKPDPAAAMGWYLKAADRGDLQAMIRLGDMLSQGRGTARDAKEAYRWYRTAAQGGDTGAQRAAREIESALTKEDIAGIERDLE